MLLSAKKNTKDTQKSKDKDLWDKLDILSKALIPVALLAGGYFVNHRLNIISQRQSNIRAALELQNGRESSETELRGSMFAKILDKYSKSGGQENVAMQLLYLELLVSNFNYSLDLSPMLKEVTRKINSLPANEERDKLLQRLSSVIGDAQSKQLASIAIEGAIKPITLNAGDHASENVVVLSCEQGAEYPLRIPIRITLTKKNPDASANLQVTQFIREGQKRYKAETILSADSSDLPLIDNLRIAPGLRMAFLIGAAKSIPSTTPTDANSTLIHALVFPNEIASLKDRLQFTDYLETLNQDKRINPETEASKNDQCRTLTKRVSFSSPLDYDFAEIPISN